MLSGKRIYSGLPLGWIHGGVGAGFEDNLWFKKQGSSLNPPLQNLYSTKSLGRYNTKLQSER